MGALPASEESNNSKHRCEGAGRNVSAMACSCRPNADGAPHAYSSVTGARNDGELAASGGDAPGDGAPRPDPRAGPSRARPVRDGERRAQKPPSGTCTRLRTAGCRACRTARGRGQGRPGTPERPHREDEHGRFHGCASSRRTEAAVDRGGTGDLRFGLLASHRLAIARVRPSDCASPGGARARLPADALGGTWWDRSWTAVAGAASPYRPVMAAATARRARAAEAGGARPDLLAGRSDPRAGHHAGRGSEASRHGARPSFPDLARDGRGLPARGLTRTRAAPVPSTAPHGAGGRCGTRSAPAAPGPWCGPCPRSAGARW
ncbi:hypothetical protein SAMN04490357_7256 [Streptomyces misionensis]|uniref:Uncharacterized protein n=1 Tax=Streptomyces misionensis TaxID=67331 RepID=A0A1H5GWA8_9ACTN|nr:hypothetical protein SAMN04490357_7256 [Streptomyces misionensis]